MRWMLLRERDEQQSAAELKQNPSRIIIHYRKAGTDQVTIRFIDNGPEFQKEVTTCFDPSSPLKQLGKEQVWGLSISYQSVTRKHQGPNLLPLDPGQGTEFQFKFPSNRFHS
jgi:hypothetical protein